MQPEIDFSAVVTEFESTRKKEMPKIFTHVFVNNFLPTIARSFSGEQVDLSPWLSVVGQPSASAMAINDDGSEAFIIPPILAPVKPRDVGDSRLTASEIMTRATSLYGVSPGKGDKFMNETLPLFYSKLDGVEEFRKKWADIFTSYGYDVMENPSETKIESGGGLELYDYEDF